MEHCCLLLTSHWATKASKLLQTICNLYKMLKMLSRSDICALHNRVLQQLADSGLASPHSWVCSSAHRSLAPSDLSYLCYSNRTRIAHNVFQETVSSGEHVCIASQSSQSPKPCQITKSMFNMRLKTDSALSASAGSMERPDAFVIEELGLNTEYYSRPDGASVYRTMLEFF